jgi:hypothetical protein
VVDKAERDAALDRLQDAFNNQVDNRLKRLNKQKTFLKNILEGRGTTERVQNDVLNKLGVIAETDLERFLSG